jgi:hypothetical protein
MQKPFNIITAPVPPLRAESRHQPETDAGGHIQGVEASSGGLIRATLGAAAAGGAILLFFWLPAEYGIDPTRVGRLLGLTEMGQIKQQLYAEADAEDAALAAAPTALAVAPPPASDPNIAIRLDAIESQVTAIAAVVGADRIMAVPAAQAPVEAPAVSNEAAPAVAPVAQVEPTGPVWRDEVSYTLASAEGIEVKLVMAEGGVAEFEWMASGGGLNFETHGDGGGNQTSYDTGRGVPEQSGTLTAAFTGNHGWFWRNRTSEPVTFTLRTRGDYSEMKLP